MRNRLNNVVGINQTTRNRLRRQVRIGLEKGESVERVANRIEKVFRPVRARGRRCVHNSAPPPRGLPTICQAAGVPAGWGRSRPQHPSLQEGGRTDEEAEATASITGGALRAGDAKYGFGRLIDLARAEPVAVSGEFARVA